MNYNLKSVVLNASALPVHHSDPLYFSPLCDNMIYNLNADLCFEIVLTFQRLTPTPLPPVGLSLRYIIYELNFPHVYRLVSSPRRVQMCRGKSYVPAKRRTHRLRLKKTKCVRGANPRPMVLNASALPLHHSDLLYFVSSLRKYY